MASRQRQSRRERRRRHAQRNRRVRRSAIAGAGVAAGAAFAITPAAQALDFPVTNKNDGVAPGPPGSLRKAISDANASPGADRIVFDSSLSGSLNLMNTPSLPITEALHVDGPGADVLTIDAYFVNNVRIFTVDPVNPGDPVTISGLSLAYGDTTGSGGAILNVDAKLTVDSAFLYGNTANPANPTPTTIGGGAIVDAAAYASGAQMTIRDTTILGNTALAGSAGGVASVSQMGRIVNSTIANNNAATDGGGVFSVTGGILQNSTIAGNEADDDGGGIATVGSGGPSPSVENSIVGENTAAGTGDDLFGSDPFNADFSLLQNTTGVTINTAVPASNIIGTDPGLTSYATFGDGPTPTLLPDFDSPVIDQGRTAASATTDQRGEPRPFDLTGFANSAAAGADGADMGSVELTLNETTPADLALELSDAPDPVFVGDPLTYTLAVDNDGPEDATNVEVRNFIPDEVAFNSGSSPGCSAATDVDGTTVTCLLNSIVSGATGTRSFVVNPLAPAASQPYVSTYSLVSGDQVDPGSYNNFGYVDTVVRNRSATSVPVPPSTPPAFNLAAAIKQCKKKLRGKRRAKCIKKARRKAAASAAERGDSALRHPWLVQPRPPGLPEMPMRAYRMLLDR